PVRIPLVDGLEGAPVGQRDREGAAHAVTAVANASNASTERAGSFSGGAIEIVQGSPDGMNTPALSWNSHARPASFSPASAASRETPRANRPFSNDPPPHHV